MTAAGRVHPKATRVQVCQRFTPQVYFNSSWKQVNIISMIFAKKTFVIKNGLYLEVSAFAEHPNVGWDQEIGFHHVKHAATNLKKGWKRWVRTSRVFLMKSLPRSMSGTLPLISRPRCSSHSLYDCCRQNTYLHLICMSLIHFWQIINSVDDVKYTQNASALCNLL